MNDRYLFKAKRVDNGEWTCGSLITGVFHMSESETDIPYILNVDESGADCFEDFTEDAEYFEVNPETICQCTGLKDKNGNLIWENDIVKDERGNLYKAFWQDNYYQFSWVCMKSNSLPFGAKWDFYSFRNYEIEVVGNMFDNPELLESEE